MSLYNSNLNHAISRLSAIVMLLSSSLALAIQVDFDDLNAGDPPGAVPATYPDIAVVTGPAGTSIQSGTPYDSLSGNVLRVMNNTPGEYLGIQFTESHQRFVFDIAQFPGTEDGGTVYLTCLDDDRFMLDFGFNVPGTSSSGFYEQTIDFDPSTIIGGSIQCDEIRVSTSPLVGNISTPLGHIAIDCLRTDEDIENECITITPEPVTNLRDLILRFRESGVVLPGEAETLLRIYSRVERQIEKGRTRSATRKLQRLIRYTHRHLGDGITCSAAEEIIAFSTALINDLSEDRNTRPD